MNRSLTNFDHKNALLYLKYVKHALEFEKLIENRIQNELTVVL